MDMFDRLNSSFKSVLTLFTVGCGWWDILIFPFALIVLRHFDDGIYTFVNTSVFGNAALYVVIGIIVLLGLRSLYSSYVYIPYKGFGSFWFGIGEPIVVLVSGVLFLMVVSRIYWLFDAPIPSAQLESVLIPLFVGLFLPRFFISFLLAIGVVVTALVRGELFSYFSFNTIEQLLNKVREIYANPQRNNSQTSSSYSPPPQEHTATLIDEIEFANDARIRREERDINEVDFNSQCIKGRNSSKQIRETDRPTLPRKLPPWRRP